jgi:hypothetical protein
MEGTHLLLSLLWKAGYKVSRKRPRFAKTLSIPRFSPVPGQCKLSPERKQAVCSIPALIPTGKSENFWEPQVSVEPGSLTTPSWPNPCQGHKGGEQEPLIWGREQKKAFKDCDTGYSRGT